MGVTIVEVRRHHSEQPLVVQPGIERVTQTIAKQISEMAWQKGKVAEGETAVSEPAPLYNAVELLAQVEQLEADMKSAALLLQFECADHPAARVAGAGARPTTPV